jgi:hypothetical protein
MTRRLPAALAAVIALGAAAAPAGAAPTTYAANCGQTGYLDYKPSSWSNGCTGGAFNAEKAHWRTWSSTSARASARMALRDPLCRPTCPAAKTFNYRARITLSRPRTCHGEDGEPLRFFSRVSVRVLWTSGNPFHERPGWHTSRFHIPNSGSCALAP